VAVSSPAEACLAVVAACLAAGTCQAVAFPAACPGSQAVAPYQVGNPWVASLAADQSARNPLSFCSRRSPHASWTRQWPPPTA